MSIITNDPERCAIAASALRNVIDPEIGLNIVDLGLVYQVDFDEQKNAVFTSMTLTTQFCPMGESIIDAATRAIQQAFEEYTIHINLTFDPPWKSSMISEEGRDFLNS